MSVSTLPAGNAFRSACLITLGLAVSSPAQTEGKGQNPDTDLLAAEEAAPSPATYTPFGTGCAGSAGIPVLAAAPGQLPYVGETFEMDITSIPVGVLNIPFGLLGNSTSAWAGISLPRDLALYGMAGCTQYVSIEHCYILWNAGGTAMWGIPIPNDSVLVGMTFYTQVFVFDFGVNIAINSPLALVSNAAEGVVGSR